ncbi:hypothetical protein BDZ91DRAFT_804274 [Kalaharituber pfeilii]|nr:hypothetical protein BDZ91DRAFT_804274 [Kalaharituber pfeilii]
MRERIRNIISCLDAPLSKAVLRDILVDVVNSWVNQIMLPGPSDIKRVQRMLGFLLDCWEKFKSASEGLEYNYLLDVTEFDTAIQLRWAASPNTLISKELLTSSEALPVVHNNYRPVISLIAGLGPIFCPKYEADKEKEKIVSIVLSDEDIEIFCEGIRDVEGLGVDLEIEQEEKEVFGLGSPTIRISLRMRGMVTIFLLKGIFLLTLLEILVMEGWIVLENPSVSQPMGSPAQAVSSQIISTPEARSPAAGSHLAIEREVVEGWSSVLSAAEILAGMKEGGE